MNQEKELERHNKVLETIRNATSKEELPNASISAITRYLENNATFDGEKISQKEFKPVLDAILKYDFFTMPEVKEVFINVLKENYPGKTEEEYEQKYNLIAQSSNIGHYIIEASERSGKLQEFKEKDDLEKHNQTLKQIKDAYEIKDLPKVGIGTLNGKILGATKNDFIERFSIEQIREISEMLLKDKSEEEIEEKIYHICESFGFDDEQTNLMYQQIESQLFTDKTIGYTLEEIQEKEKRILQIYKMDHEETMENIKNAKRISQLPPNLTSSNLTSYLSGNTTIYPKAEKIFTSDLKNLTQYLLDKKDFNSTEIENELRLIVEKYYPQNVEEAYTLLKEKLSKLPRTQYLVEEINYSQSRQEEFVGKNCSNVNVYFVPNPKSPIEGGRFYNCYINRVSNLDLGQIVPLNLDEIVPKGMDVDSLEWYIQEYHDSTFKTAGGIILNKDETIGNVNVFKPEDGKIGITPEENARFKELQELGKEVKEIIRKKNENSERFKQMQEAYFKYQEESDKQLQELEAKIDSLMQKQEQEQTSKKHDENDDNEAR